MLGAQIDGPEKSEFNGLDVDLWPRISWSPSFAICFADLEVPPLSRSACSVCWPLLRAHSKHASPYTPCHAYRVAAALYWTSMRMNQELEGKRAQPA